jgi:hypothetical protein
MNDRGAVSKKFYTDSLKLSVYAGFFVHSSIVASHAFQKHDMYDFSKYSVMSVVSAGGLMWEVRNVIQSYKELQSYSDFYQKRYAQECGEHPNSDNF